MYSNPKDVMSACHVATGGPTKCVEELTNSRFEVLGAGTRFGVNVVPLENPSSVLYPELKTTPWDNGTCVNTEWTLYKG